MSPIQSSISCLTTNSFNTFILATEHLDAFSKLILSYISDQPIEYDQIISIVSGCSHLVNCVNTFQYLFIEYAIDDYLYLDTQFDLIYEKVVEILHHLHNLTTIDSEIYYLEKKLLCYLPSNYLNQITSSLPNRIALTLVTQTSQLFLSSYESLLNTHDDDNSDSVLTSSFLFSTSPVSINIENNNRTKNQIDTSSCSESLLQLDKIDIRTPSLKQSRFIPAFQIDFNDLNQIEKDLKENSNNQTDWMIIERKFFMNITSIWSNSNSNLNIQTINPWSSETLWTLVMHFKNSSAPLASEFYTIIQWCLCLLTVQAYNRDWDFLLSKTLVNAIIANRWATTSPSQSIHLTIVGHGLNQMFLRLIRIATILQYMKVLREQSLYLNIFANNTITSNLNHLQNQIEGTFRLLVIWLSQHADTYINVNSLERTLIICKSDQTQISITIRNLLQSLRQLENCEQIINLVNNYHSKCEIIVHETMPKLYQRIQTNALNYFDTNLPFTTNELHTNNQERSHMPVACDKILKPLLSQCECLNIEKKTDIYENILSSFVQAWSSTIRNRQYRLSDEITNFLQKDYEHLQAFLSMNIPDEDIVQLLNKSSSIQEISTIINGVCKGYKQGSESSISGIPNHDKWFRSRKSSLSLFRCVQYLCCCQRRNRVTTDYT